MEVKCSLQLCAGPAETEGGGQGGRTAAPGEADGGNGGRPSPH